MSIYAEILLDHLSKSKSTMIYNMANYQAILSMSVLFVDLRGAIGGTSMYFLILVAAFY